MIQSLLRLVVAGAPVAPSALEEVLHSAMAGTADPVALGGLLAALSCRAPEPGWLAAGARALRAHGTAIRPQVRPLVDTCGTGGDGAGTFNISTAAAFVVAAAGCAVAKHGNRGVSSPVGSADVLEALGCRLALPPERATRLLDATGFVFLFAPSFHPAMRHVAPVRKALGVRTLFNLLGPLVNPAHAEFQLLGVYDPALTGVVAEALGQLGSRGALVVHCDGLDEIGLHAVTTAHLLRDGTITSMRIDPTALGLAPQPVSALAGTGNPADNGDLLARALAGEGGPRSDVVALNAGAALWVAGRVRDLAEGLELARDRIKAGTALRVQQRYAESSAAAESEREVAP